MCHFKLFQLHRVCTVNLFFDRNIFSAKTIKSILNKISNDNLIFYVYMVNLKNTRKEKTKITLFLKK